MNRFGELTAGMFRLGRWCDVRLALELAIRLVLGVVSGLASDWPLR